MLPEGGMAAMMTDVCPHNLRREKVTHATLYGAALRGVIVVEAQKRCVRVRTSKSIRPPPGRTQTQHGENVRAGDQQPVKLTGLRVRRRPTFMPGLDQLAVHVPFHIVNWVFAQQP